MVIYYMQVKKYNVVNPKKYTSNGQEKTFWANVGTLTEFHKADGTVSRVLEMNHMDVQFQVFEQEQKQGTQFPPSHTSADVQDQSLAEGVDW